MEEAELIVSQIQTLLVVLQLLAGNLKSVSVLTQKSSFIRLMDVQMHSWMQHDYLFKICKNLFGLRMQTLQSIWSFL